MAEAASAPGVPSVLDALTRERLLDLGRVTGTGLRPTRDSKRELAATLGAALGRERLPEILRELGRDELRAVCRAHGLTSEDSRRAVLAEQLLVAAGFPPGASAPAPVLRHDGVPQPGQILAARGRQWLVEDAAPGDAQQSPLLSCRS